MDNIVNAVSAGEPLSYIQKLLARYKVAVWILFINKINNKKSSKLGKYN